MRSQRTTHDLVCVQCGASFQASRPHGRYCGQVCKKAYHATQYRRMIPVPGVHLPTGTRGAVAELLACADLMDRGYHVFRAMSPSCPCDIVVWTPDGKVLRVEVKMAIRHLPSGKIVGGVTTRNAFDVVCYVLRGEGDIVYDPPIEAW